MQNKVLTERQQYWLDHIYHCNQSGKRMSEYARDQDFPVRAMYDAKKMLVQKGFLPRARASYETRFEQVQIIESASQSEWRIALPSGAVVEFSAMFDEQTLSTILKSAART